MRAALPIKSLYGLNLLLALVISVTVWLFLSHIPKETHPLLYTVMTAIAITLIGFANTFILMYLVKQFELGSWKFKLYRYISTYAVSLGAYLSIWPGVAFFTNRLSIATDYVGWGALILGSAIVNTMIIILQNFVILQSQKAHADLELSNLKAAHAEAANQLLKQQIHPHFLFNALNTLKALYKKDAQAGEVYLVYLASFLRASVSSHSAKVSRVEEELALLKAYLEMQKIRFGQALTCTLAVPESSVDHFYLPSFTLQPLLENAIKHNELTEAAPLRVSLCQQGDRLIVSNNRQRKSTKMDSTNHGLANLADRYRLLSGDEVIITADETQFSVSIKLLTDEYSHH